MDRSQARRNRKRRAEILTKKRIQRPRIIKATARKKSSDLKKKLAKDSKKLAAELKKKARQISRVRKAELKKAARKKSKEMKLKAKRSAKKKLVQLKKDARKKSNEMKKAAKLAQKKIDKDLAKKLAKENRSKERLEKKEAQKEIARLRKEDRSNKRRSRLRRLEMRKNKPQKSKFDCSSDNAAKLQRKMISLVPTVNQIERMTQKRYTDLRSDMSKSLTAVKTYSSNCNKSYGREKASLKKKTKSRSRGLVMPVRDIFIPDIGVDVCNECPISEGQFARAQAKLKRKSRSGPKPKFPVKRAKKRIAPMLVR